MSPGRAPGRRDDVLAVLREAAEPLSIAQIGTTLHVHPNTVRFHLDALVGSGRVDRVPTAPAGPGRPPLLFRARRGMDPTGPRSYQLLATALVEDMAARPDPAVAAVAAGRSWGRRLVGQPVSGSWKDGVRSLVALLDDIGFAPEWPASDGHADRIGLRHCPFLELADTSPGVVCPLHLGLMQGAVSALGAPVTVERLEPLVATDLCMTHLARSSAIGQEDH